MKKYILILFFILFSLSISPNYTASGGGATQFSLTTNKNQAIANGTDAISFTVFEFFWECIGPFDEFGNKETVSDPNECAAYNPPTAQQIPDNSISPITISVSGSGNILSTTSLSIGNDGMAYFTLKSNSAETKTVTLTKYAGTEFEQTVQAKSVTFTAPTSSSPAPANSTTPTQSTSQNKAAPTTTVATETAPPAIPTLETVKLGDTEVATDKITERKFKKEETKIFKGKTVANGIVRLYFQSDPFEDTTTADQDGNWSYELKKDLGAGEHTLQIASTDPTTNLTSEKSAPIKFEILDVENITEANQEKVTQKKKNIPLYIGVGVLLLSGLAIGGLFWFKKRKNASNKIPGSFSQK